MGPLTSSIQPPPGARARPYPPTYPPSNPTPPPWALRERGPGGTPTLDNYMVGLNQVQV